MDRPILPHRGALAALALALSAAACTPAARPGQRPPSVAEGPMVPVEVREADFSASLFSVLRDGAPSAPRSGLLVGVVRRQLAHAARRFAAGQAERGADSVFGALLLVRAGEGRAGMIDAAGERALAGALDRVAPRGDEGRAQALMEMRAAALPAGSSARGQVEQHLAAIGRWVQDTRTGGSLERLGAEQRALVSRALVDSRPEATERAAAAISAWIDRAIEFNIQFRQSGQLPGRDEAHEAERALESGGATLVALFLRHGDARGALAHIDASGARRVVPRGLYDRLKGAATRDDAGSWRALAEAFAVHRGEGREAETGLDGELLDAALWGSALEAYRREPTEYESATLLAQLLVRFGMSEAAPLVLGPALGDRPTPQALGGVMGFVLSAMAEDAGSDDLDAARRTFTAAAPLLVLADGPAQKGRVAPSAARVRFLMGTVELRAGDLAAALPLLRGAAEAEPSVAGLTLLAMAERQGGDLQAASATLRRALSAPDALSAPAEVAEAHMLAFEIQRDGGAPDQAKGSLDAALAAALAARQRAQGPSAQARGERLLGRVLDAYGDAKGASRAEERALALATADRPLLGPTMLDAVGRALVRGDLSAARRALQHAIDDNASEDDLVYGGLWVLLLERQLKAPPDGTSERALGAATNRAAWTAKLVAWASGKLSDADLGAQAQSAAQRVEALFYTAMAKKVAGDPAAEERLRTVSRSPVLDLLEVHLARELLAPRMRAELPANVKLP